MIPTCRSRITTDPSTNGPNRMRSKRPTPIRPIWTGVIAPNNTIAFIANSDVVARRRFITAQPCHASSTGRPCEPRHRGPRGSPFHLPARLADGLGPGSDLGHGYPRPYAPSSKYIEESGSPALALRKERQLRLLK